MSPEEKIMAVRSVDVRYGFEEVSGEQEEVVSEMSEEFVWGRNCGFKLKMEGIWPVKYSKFRYLTANSCICPLFDFFFCS